MAETSLNLTYRDLAERLGISTDAARMKARRAVKSGRWRIIPGNHPNDPVRVELPVSDLTEPKVTGGERPARSTGEHKGRTNARTDSDTLAVTLQAAQARIAELTDQLTAEKDQHRETAVELAKATVRIDTLSGELARLDASVVDLEHDLERARRSWWQKLTGQ